MAHRRISVLVPALAVLALGACSGDELTPGQVATSPVTLTDSAATDAAPPAGQTTDGTVSPTGEAPTECGLTLTEDHVGDVVVDGVTCIGAVTIDGNVIVGSGGALVAEGATVEGDIQGEGHGSVSVTGGEVEGNIQLEGGGSASVTGVAVDGDLQSFSNSGPQEFRNNVIDGNLQCEGSTPPPGGAGNVVAGDKEGQCSAL